MRTRKPAKLKRAAPRKRPADAKPQALRKEPLALGAFAHDIRTPLTGIIAFADLLILSDLPERERRWAEAIKNAGDHLAHLTTLIVDAAKADAAGLVVAKIPFTPERLVREAAAALTARAEAKGLTAAFDIAAPLPARAEGDAVRLRSALENLFDNAVKFTERGTIAFRVETKPLARGRARLTFIVTDSGIGMSTADRKRLMQPFAQGSEDVARRFGGAGLGLSSVRRIAQAMGGRLTVKSRPGAGSTFTLSVSVRVIDNTMPTPAQPSLRILCVEDNPYGRVVLQAVLRELGHATTFAGSGETALDLLSREIFDAVLLDMALPGIDGIETARRLRRLDGPNRATALIGLSGRTAPEGAQDAGLDAFLRKPVSPAELSALLARLVSARAT